MIQQDPLLSIDAIGTQVDMAQKIVDKPRYFLTVTDNQKRSL